MNKIEREKERERQMGERIFRIDCISTPTAINQSQLTSLNISTSQFAGSVEVNPDEFTLKRYDGEESINLSTFIIMLF